LLGLGFLNTKIMRGAEKSHLFKTGQYGRLYITSGSHARGNTLRIQVLPEGEIAIPNGNNNSCLNRDAVEVYGEISGQLGCKEVYGWLHEGKWQDDFIKLVIDAEKKIEYLRKQSEKSKIEKQKQEEERLSKLLNDY
jgi:hypothetical protein